MTRLPYSNRHAGVGRTERFDRTSSPWVKASDAERNIEKHGRELQARRLARLRQLRAA